MTKVLIIGYSNIFGGIERFICGLVDLIDKDKISIELLLYKKLSAEQEAELKKRNLNIYYVPQCGKKPFSFLKQIFRFYGKRTYDVVHIHSSHAVSILYALPIWFYKRVKIVYHSHNMDGNTKLLHLICKQIVKRRSDIQLACSIPAAEYMYDTSKGVEIIKNGIDLDRFAFDPNTRNRMRRLIQADSSTIIIGNIGRFVEEKNPFFIIDILVSLKRSGRNAKVVYVGDGLLKRDVEKYADAMGVEKDTIFTGQVNNPQDWYQAFDAFVLPSRYEGFPFVGVEAQANDLWVFLSDSITPEIQITSKSVLVSIEKGANYWADLIYNRVHGGKTSRRDISGEMRSKGYDFADTVKRIEEIYNGE